MKRNEGAFDRSIRTVLGLGLLLSGIYIQGTVGTGLIVFGMIPLLTGLVGYCPLYSLFGWNSCPSKK